MPKFGLGIEEVIAAVHHSTMIRCKGLRSTILGAAFIVASVFSGGAGWACSYARNETSISGTKENAQRAFAEADLVVDAEVISPGNFGPASHDDGLLPVSALKVLNVWKGEYKSADQDNILFVIYLTSCDIGFSRKGEKVRVILNGGHEIYRAEQLLNGYAQDYLVFSAEIDRLIGQKRAPDVSMVPGAVEEPTS